MVVNEPHRPPSVRPACRSHLWLSYSKTPLQPALTQKPFDLWPCSLFTGCTVKLQSAQSAQLDWRLLTSDLVREGKSFMSDPKPGVSPPFSCCANGLALWCSFTVSGHYIPPSASTALCAPVHLAPSVLLHLLIIVPSQHITSSRFARPPPACWNSAF